MKRIFLIFMLISIAVGSALACFDTYLFLNKYSMVYPKGKIVLDTLAEYSVNNVSLPSEDTFLMNFNLYYGFLNNFSLQVGVSSSEKTRNEFGIDEFGFRAVLNLINQPIASFVDNYTFDLILEHHEGIFGKNVSFEFSAPNIFYKGNWVMVVHPVFSLANLETSLVEYSLGGHLGIFYLFGTALVGVGAEYQSAQNGAAFGNRIIEGESGVSLFFGAKIGENVYIQNEFAKGLANSRDFGFALTVKLIP
ncbi:MAG: hypothetical protein ACP5KI_05495 [Brevinematia bacterium]